MSLAEPKNSNQPGWFSDPWGIYTWRWWDGFSWTANVSVNQKSQPRLPAWLSVPVCCALVVQVPIIMFILVKHPVEVYFAFVPLVLMFPGLWWLNRIEPQPGASRTHAFLWGATVAHLVSYLVNMFTYKSVGLDVVVVVSAPIIEEIAKGLAIVWALRRKEIDSVMDAIVFGSWSALGFAVVENMTYFKNASNNGNLGDSIVARAFESPFPHPLFTFWTALAIGLSVRWGQPRWLHILWGLPLAVVAHAGWNGAILFTRQVDPEASRSYGYIGYVLLFVAVLLALFLIQRRQQQTFVRLIPLLSSRYGISKAEVEVFGDWRSLLATRRTLTRRQAVNFDRLHAALAKLAVAHGGPAAVTRAQEELLASQLIAARSRAFADAGIDNPHN